MQGKPTGERGNDGRRQRVRLPESSKREQMANVSEKAPKALVFEAVAQRIVDLNDISAIRDQLRLIWNARGAADIATIESALFGIMRPADVGRYLKRLDRAIRALDRT
jgi:hypothetical protein